MDKAISENHSTATAPEMSGLASFDRIAAYKAEQSHSVRVVNQQEYPFQQSSQLAGGIARGVVHASEGFIEFLAQPEAVSNALIGIGPQLDNAVNYYANTASEQVTNHVGEALKAVHHAAAQYSHLPAEKRGEIIGQLGAQVMAGEVCGEISMQPIRSGSRDLFNSLRTLDAKDISHLPEDMQNGARAIESATEITATTERGMIKVSRLFCSERHAQHVQQIVDALPEELQLLLHKSGLQIKAVEKADRIFKDSPNVRARLHPDTRAIYIAEKFQRNGKWISEPETLAVTVRHEVGHVIDRTGGFSHQKSMMDAYRAGCKRLGTADKSYFDYFATGDEKGSMEAFAEIYAQLKTSKTVKDAPTRAAFARAFPEMIEAVRQLDLP
jgi:hypothetical protein